jgi:Family of unknown function (DUF6399)
MPLSAGKNRFQICREHSMREWEWTIQTLKAQTQDSDTQDWVLTVLLPWVYWHQQTQKTRQPQLKQGYLQAAQMAEDALLKHPFTLSLQESQQQQWVDWAIWMCAKFQRSSSTVEGRNGYLSRLHHANRGFTEQSLKVLTPSSITLTLNGMMAQLLLNGFSINLFLIYLSG